MFRGKKEWTGNWSDSSNLWTQDLRKQLNVHNRDDGVFFIDIDDFLFYFTMMTVCMCVDDY